MHRNFKHYLAIVERVVFVPIINLPALLGVGSRVADHAINVILLYPFPVPEDMRLVEHQYWLPLGPERLPTLQELTERR
jgi:hypothetical protein